MAEYNPSKIIKDGNTYNFRDTTKIPLAGSNQISGSLIPATTDTYDFGSSSYQWNNAYIKSLTINGVACGDILTHNVSEFVDVSSNQTIGGVKTFSNGLFTSRSTAGDLAILEDSSINSTNEDANGMPLTNHANSLRIKGARSSVLPFMMVAQVATSGDTNTEFRVYKYKDLNKRAGINIYYTYANDKARSYFINFDYILSGTTNTTNLGSPSLQWNNTYTRNILIDNDINIASSLINKTSNSGVLTVRGGINDSEGASLSLYGKDYGGSPGLIGNIYMTAYGNSDYTNFRIYPNGIIRVYNNSTATTKNVAMQEDVIPRSGGAVITGLGFGRSVNDDQLRYHGGMGWDMGATLSLYGKDEASFGGKALLHPSDGMNSKNMWIYPNGSWTWDGTACQITSDQRYKQQITEIDDKLLDAWEDVNLVQFKYNDAVDQKKDKARLHTGYVVQQIDNACKEHGVDVSQYGLYCHEEYPEETEEVEVEQADGTKTKERKVIREANEHYSLRYTEALIVECAYLRKKNKELQEQLDKVIARLDKLEGVQTK